MHHFPFLFKLLLFFCISLLLFAVGGRYYPLVKVYDPRTKRFDQPYATGNCAGEGTCGTCFVEVSVFPEYQPWHTNNAEECGHVIVLGLWHLIPNTFHNSSRA